MEKKNKKIEKNSAEIEKKSKTIQENSAKNQKNAGKMQENQQKIEKNFIKLVKNEKLSQKNQQNSEKIQKKSAENQKSVEKSKNFPQKSEKNIKKPAQNTNVEIYNYLNLVDRRLGKLYKHSGFSPLPANFFVDEKVIERALILGEMKRENFEDFEVPEKKTFKKMLKISLKNCKKLQKIDVFADESNLSNHKVTGAAEDFETYLVMRKEVTHQILKDMRNHDFDETAAYAELFNLNPVFGEILDTIFQTDFDAAAALENLPQKYNLIYNKNLKSIAQRKKQLAQEKQNSKNKKTQQQLQALKDLENLQKLNNVQRQQKLQEKENLQKTAKISAKNAKKVEKTEILRKNLQNKQDAKAVREQNSKNKIQSRSK